MITVKDKQFIPYLSPGEIESRVAALGETISQDYEEKDPLFIAVLNGAFMFAAELFKHISIPASITFVKVSSYKNTETTGVIEEILGLEYNIANRNIIIVEDIVDTGITMAALLDTMKEYHPASISIASLLVKPTALIKPITVNYCGFEIENKFVVGYGMDYDTYGRNLNGIYQVM
jgi:hypoxanthine phosphoribosyltransferase